MNNLLIRPAQANDANAVFALLVEFAMSYVSERAAFDRHYPELLESKSADLLVAEKDGQVAGYALDFDLLTLFANGVVTELQELMVEPKQRGQGIGVSLVKEAITRAKARGSVEVTVPTRRAGEFYKRLGFKDTADYFKLELDTS